MAIGPPDKTYVQIMKERFFRLVLVVGTTLGYLTLFGAVMIPHRELGLAMAPFVALLYWRILSKLITGSQFSLAIKIQPVDLQEVFNVIFTVLFSINLIVFAYHLLTWHRVGS